MKQRHLIWLLGVLALLVLLAFVAGVFDRDVSTIEVPGVHIPAERLEQVRIERPEGPLVAARQDGRWRLTAPHEAAADSAAVARFVQELEALELASVVSTSPERYARYGVDSAAAAVTAAWPGGSYRLVVGDQGPDYQTMYVRVQEDPRVFATRGRVNLPQHLDAWRDRTVLHLDPGQVTGATVERPEETYEVTQGPDGRWEVVVGSTRTPADSSEVMRWLQRFAPLRAAGFLDDVPASAVQEGAAYRVAFRLAGEAAPALWMQARGDTLAVAPGTDGTTYQLAPAQPDTYAPARSTFAPE